MSKKDNIKIFIDEVYSKAPKKNKYSQTITNEFSNVLATSKRK